MISAIVSSSWQIVNCKISISLTIYFINDIPPVSLKLPSPFSNCCFCLHQRSWTEVMYSSLFVCLFNFFWQQDYLKSYGRICIKLYGGVGGGGAMTRIIPLNCGGDQDSESGIWISLIAGELLISIKWFPELFYVKWTGDITESDSASVLYMNFLKLLVMLWIITDKSPTILHADVTDYGFRHWYQYDSPILDSDG